MYNVCYISMNYSNVILSTSICTMAEEGMLIGDTQITSKSQKHSNYLKKSKQNLTKSFQERLKRYGLLQSEFMKKTSF